MRKNLFYLLLPIFVFSCSEEDENAVERTLEQGCYLSEVTASNLETYKYFMEDGKLVGIGYGDQPSQSVYNYDNDGKLVSLVYGDYKMQYFYNGAGKIIRSETRYDGVLKTKVEWTYGTDGFPLRTLSSHGLDEEVQSFVETELVYKGGNPVKRTSYLFRSDNPDKINPLITVIQYDDKKNPYNTHNSSVAEPMVNNPVQFDYLSDPESKTVVTYTYNDDGYPITYNYHYPDRTDGYADVYGELIYECEGD